MLFPSLEVIFAGCLNAAACGPLAVEAWPFCIYRTSSGSVTDSFHGGQGIFILQGQEAVTTVAVT